MNNLNLELKEHSKSGAILIYLLVLGLVSIPIFGFLDTLPIQIWDESRNALNALSLYYSGDWLITKFGGQADLWNTKPPLLIWLQVIFMKLMGPSELAIRLPSAIAAFLTCVSLIRFFHKQFNQIWIGAFASLVLITSYGYVVVHGARTGDFDVLLSLFILLAVFWAYKYSQIPSAKNFLIFCLFISLGVYTKGIAAFLMLPGIAVFLAYKKLIPTLLKSGYFYLGILASISFISLFYVSRELADSGYLNAVYENELGGRFIEGADGHQHGFWFYFYELADQQFDHWLFLVPIGFFVGFLAYNGKFKDLSLLLFIVSLSYLLVISFSATKLVWYLMPVFPMLSILVAFFIGLIFEIVRASVEKGNRLSYIFVLLGALYLIFNPALSRILDFTNKPAMNKEKEEFYSLSFYLKEALTEKTDLSRYKIIEDGYLPHILFYTSIMNANGVSISFASCENVEVGDQLIIRNIKIPDCLGERFDYTVEDFDKYSSLVNVKNEMVIN